MIFSTILGLLAIGLVSAQNIFELHTEGRGGDEICGNIHLCNDNARCLKQRIDDTDYKMCVCQDGLTGNGKLFCKNPLDHTLYIQSDPHVKNFFNEFASLPSPCRYRLALLNMVPSEGSSAVVELFGENLLFRGGEYFLSKLTMSTEILLNGELLKQTLEFYGDVTVDGKYTLYAKSLALEGLTIGAEADLYHLRDELFMGYSMDVDKDAINNLLNVTIPNLGITLLFRPPSIEAELDNTLLPMVPGAVFIVSHETWPMVLVDESDLEISSWPTGPSLKDVANTMSLTKSHLVQYLMLNNTLSTPIYNDDVCLETSRIWREECVVEDTRRKMLEYCTPIYSNKNFLNLLTDSRMGDRNLDLQKKLYRHCELAVCAQKLDECEVMKKEMIRLFGDRLPAYFKNLDCKKLVQ